MVKRRLHAHRPAAAVADEGQLEHCLDVGGLDGVYFPFLLYFRTDCFGVDASPPVGHCGPVEYPNRAVSVMPRMVPIRASCLHFIDDTGILRSSGPLASSWMFSV